MKISTKLSALTLGIAVLLSAQAIALDNNEQNTFIQPKYNTYDPISKALGIEKDYYIQAVTCEKDGQTGTLCKDGFCAVGNENCGGHGGNASAGYSPAQRDNVI